MSINGTTGTPPTPFNASYDSPKEIFTLLPPEGQVAALSFTPKALVTWLSQVIPGPSIADPTPLFAAILPAGVTAGNITVNSLVICNASTPIYVNFSGGVTLNAQLNNAALVPGFTITGIGLQYTQGTAPAGGQG